MNRIRIIADEKIPFLKGALEGVADIEYYPGKDIDRGKVREADALIIRTRTRCDRELLEGSAVRFIATATIGYDHIDTAYCDEQGIGWTNAPGCNSDSVNQYLRAALLYLTEKYEWMPEKLTLGVIGAGNVGSKLVKSASMLGFRVLVNDPPREEKEGPEGFTGLYELLEQSNVVSLHVPLQRSGKYPTWQMADASFFEALKTNAVFINTSRGEVVDERRLKESFVRGRIRSMILDVWNKEPEIDEELMRMTELSTAHIAGYSTDGKANGTMMSVRKLSAFFGLGLDDWKPGSMPSPENPSVVIDCQGMEEKEIIRAVHTYSYDIEEDSRLLRESPAAFEHIRGSYRIRREEKAYSVKLINNPWTGLPGVLEEMGFSVLETDCFC